MTRNSHDEDAEDRRKLALDFNEYFSFLMGVKYTNPIWLENLSTLKQTLFIIYRRFGDLAVFLLLVSNVVSLYQELINDQSDLRVLVTSVGTNAYILAIWGKLIIYRREQKIFDGLLSNIKLILRNLEDNPLQEKQFYKYHKHFVRCIKLYGLGKFAAVGGGVTTLTCFELTLGFMLPNFRSLPMFGWYPFDPFTDVNYVIISLFQFIAYQTFLYKDIALDLIFLTIFVSFNSYLIYLKKLLSLIVKEMNEDSTKNKENLIWWIKQYQLLLRTIEDFKIIGDPYLFITYITTGIILFFGGVLVTSNAEYDLVQQMIALGINLTNLLQLYIFSVMGDKITDNALKVAEGGFEMEMLQAKKEIKILYLFTLTRSNKPVKIKFGRINPLSLQSFGKIVEMFFSYFITVVQLRSKTS